MRGFLSKKLFVAVGSVITVVLTNVGLPEDVANRITEALTWIASSYLVAQGGADAADKFRPKD